jgi:hypothetical protein
MFCLHTLPWYWKAMILVYDVIKRWHQSPKSKAPGRSHRKELHRKKPGRRISDHFKRVCVSGAGVAGSYRPVAGA